MGEDEGSPPISILDKMNFKAKANGGESKDPKPSENQNDQMGPGAEWTVRVTNSLIALNIDFLI